MMPAATPLPSRRTRNGCLVRQLDEVPVERTICGSRRRLLSDGDDAAAFLHQVRIVDSTPHFHRETTEIYYVVAGNGWLLLDGEELAVRPGTCVEVKPGVVHSARGDIEVLVIGIPSIRESDTFVPAPEARAGGAAAAD